MRKAAPGALGRIDEAKLASKWAARTDGEDGVTTVIHAERLGKLYRRGMVEDRGMLRDTLTSFAKAPWKVFQKPKQETFWALDNVSLEVKEGEVLGLIGRNGAGKTTLLKLLSRITKPSTGYVEIRGKVRSLLEVGTGFHSELTGRENIYMSGSILGMRRREIERKMDEIVAFSEVENFINTPVKHYSSGMYVRLAFAVAAHLEPEILLVDEVLAVGDIAFQKKCMGKMGDVAGQGRTIILVSHNMAAINALCTRCVVLNGGRIDFDGPKDEATAHYYAEALSINGGLDLSVTHREGSGKARFTTVSVQATDASGRSLDVAYPGCDLSVDVELQCKSNIAHANLAIVFCDSNGYRLIDANTGQKGDFLELQAGQLARVTFQLREVLLKPGRYLIGLWLGREGVEVIDYIEYATTFEFAEGGEGRKHTVVYPGAYVCRFEESVTILHSLT